MTVIRRLPRPISVCFLSLFSIERRTLLWLSLDRQLVTCGSKRYCDISSGYLVRYAKPYLEHRVGIIEERDEDSLVNRANEYYQPKYPGELRIRGTLKCFDVRCSFLLCHFFVFPIDSPQQHRTDKTDKANRHSHKVHQVEAPVYI